MRSRVPKQVKLSFSIVILVFLSAAVWGQDSGKDACPGFHLRGPKGIPANGQVIPYFVRWNDGTGYIKPVYKWNVVGSGELVGGQGTAEAEIKVFVGNNFTVFVEIAGLPVGCPNTASETGVIDPPPVASKLGEYSGSLTRMPKDQMEGILKALKEYPGSQLFVVLSGGNPDPQRAIKSKRKVLERDIFSQFEAAPPVTIIEQLQGKEDKLSIWLVPPGATPPYQ